MRAKQHILSQTLGPFTPAHQPLAAHGPAGVMISHPNKLSEQKPALSRLILSSIANNRFAYRSEERLFG